MKYRPEIDGLRALAVVPVILFHAGVSVFSGGYIGVDIFFVISGYLITTILLNEMRKGQFSLARFYERRARRILPALFVVMVTCIPFAWFILSPSDFRDFSESLVAVSIFSSNFLFWSESGYFAGAAELKPLLHTWSLAVEEQFYIFFPLILFAVWKWVRSLLVPVLIVGFLLSLAIAQWGAVNEPSAAFYLLPTRGWELLIGGLCAHHLQRSAVPSGSFAQFASAMGLVMIWVSIFVYDEATAWPGLPALLPTVGTALIILFAGPATITGRMLAFRPFVGIGLISYSAYLWHQPLLAFAKYNSLIEPGLPIVSAIIVLTFILAGITWKWVEAPFRDRQRGVYKIPRTRLWAFSLGGAALFIALGFGMDNEIAYMGRLDERQRNLFAYLDYGRSDAFSNGTRYGQCFYASDFGAFKPFDRDICLNRKDGEETYLLLGDSHAAHLWSALSTTLAPAIVMQANASGCRPTLPLNGEVRCTQMVEYVFTDYLPQNPVNTLILSAQWQMEDVERLRTTIDSLKPYADQIVVLGPSPRFSRKLPSLLIKVHDDGTKPNSLDRFVEASDFALDDALSTAIESTSAKYVSLLDIICPDAECQLMVGETTPMIWDESHFTVEGSQWVVSKMVPSLQP